MKLGKIIGRAALITLAVTAIPYDFKEDEETGAYEIRSLLWAFKKVPHTAEEEKDHYYFAMPPSGLDFNGDEEEDDTPLAEEPLV
ncbi:MAG: hypothetical protein K5774_04445 [Clostridia bacterium]|nr:hypothetical protein [Clostridia bacterium]